MSNTKDIKDYLHFYLGCNVITTGGKGGRLVSVSTDGMAMIVYKNEDPRGYVIQQSALKPILRPFSDITKYEAIQLADYYGTYGDMPGSRVYKTYVNQFDNIVVSWGSSMREKWAVNDCEIWKPEQFRLLLSKHFDIFELIAEGLALDATQKEAIT